MAITALSHKYFTLRSVVCVLMVLWLGGCAVAPTDLPEARQGMFNLRDWNFVQQGAIPLNGQWDFYWDRLLTPADFNGNENPKPTGVLDLPTLWQGGKINGIVQGKAGMATLRLTVQVDPDQPLLALKITAMTAAYRLWLNDRLLVEQGIVGTDSPVRVACIRA